MTGTQCEQRRPDPDRLLKALAHEDRRALLTELAAHGDDTVAVDTLARRVGGLPETELYHWHLPVLAEAGLVVFDSDADRVEYTPSEAATAVLSVLDDRFGT